VSAIDQFANLLGSRTLCRRIEKKQTADYPTPYYSPVSGEFEGYSESDEHLRKRLKKILEGG
jgi:hypothetical protein